MESVEKQKIDSIIFWRVISCLGVFIVHLGQRMSLSGSIRLITDFGKYGVYMFFIISGFLGWRTEVCGKAKEYWYKRAIKILPLYYFVIVYYFVTETFIWHQIPVDDTGLGWSRYIFFLSGFIRNDTYFWSNLGITWTIPIFLLFYFLVPFLKKVIKNYKNAVLFWVFLVGIAYLVNKYCNGNLSAITYLKYFALGIILYFTQNKKKENSTIFGCIVLIIGKLILGRIDATTYAFIFVIILIVTKNMVIRGKLVKRVIYLLDKYSYTIYLGHGLIFCGILDKFSFEPITVLVIAVCGTIMVGFFAYNFVEQPIQNFFRKYVIR